MKKVNRKINKVNRKTQQSFKKMERTSRKFSALVRQTRQTKKVYNINRIPIDFMTGEQFEQYLAKLFRELGYNVRHTNITGDFGADLVLKTSKGTKIVVQAKRYSSNVGLRAVQEVYTAKSYYKAKGASVVTNNYFTSAAIKLAKVNGVELIDRDALLKLDAKNDEKIVPQGE